MLHKITPAIACVFFSSAAALHIAITGTSQGIGLDAAKRLIKDGHTVYHANRNSARSAEAAQAAGGGIPMVCDLASLESVRQFADELAGKELDVLCLNAGIAPSTKAEAPERTADGFEACVGTNHLGHFLLANLLAPKVKRIVVTASVEIATATLSSRRRVDGVEVEIQPWREAPRKFDFYTGYCQFSTRPGPARRRRRRQGRRDAGGFERPRTVDNGRADDGRRRDGLRRVHGSAQIRFASTSPPSTHGSTFTQVQGLQGLEIM